MGNLIESIDNVDQPTSVAEALRQIEAAHAYLVDLGAKAFQKARVVAPSPNWGTLAKRARVYFPAGDRPVLIPQSLRDHSLIEVINQCATVERLMDALRWAIDNLPEYQLVRCHPTTGSKKADVANVPDNDIVLIDPDGRFACFEVSDVANATNDSNRKEKKDLTSLGVYDANTDRSNRVFLVVSVEFARLLRRKQHVDFRYLEHVVVGDTGIFEILR